MKLFHTADWHLGKLVHGVSMLEDQRYVLDSFIEAIRVERPDAVIIAGDLYDRSVPPAEAVELLDRVLETIVCELETPVLAIAGNHDSPDRIHFGSRLMQSRGLYLAGRLDPELKPIVLRDEFGEVRFYLAPYADPALVRHDLGDESIRSHDDAMRAIAERAEASMDPAGRQLFVGHAFVTPAGEAAPNTSESERPLAIGGAEHVSADYFRRFHYTALGHLHQAHHVGRETVRYAGSLLKYSLSEERHRKGFLIVHMDGAGAVEVEKRELRPLRDMKKVEARIEELERHPHCEDYVFVTLLNENPVLFPMEKVRAVYPNALHVGRRLAASDGTAALDGAGPGEGKLRREAEPAELFAAFYEEVKGAPLTEEKKELFLEIYGQLLREEGSTP